MGNIIWSGRELNIGDELTVHRDPACWFDPSDAGCGLRRERPELLVAHWSGGERDGWGIYETLVERELAVEFAMDDEGALYQFADPMKTFCAHAHGVNTVSFGLEIQCRGLVPGPFKPAQLKRLNANFPRGTYKATVNGQEVSIACFNAKQLEAFVDFCDALACAKLLPRLVYGAKGAPLMGVVPLKRAKQMRGVIGHYMVSDEKTDPGPQPFEELISEGWQVVAVP